MLISIDLVFGEPKARERVNTRQAVRGAVGLSRMFPPCEAEVNFKLLSTDESVLTTTERQAGNGSLKRTSLQFHGTAQAPFRHQRRICALYWRCLSEVGEHRVQQRRMHPRSGIWVSCLSSYLYVHLSLELNHKKRQESVIRRTKGIGNCVLQYWLPPRQ